MTRRADSRHHPKRSPHLMLLLEGGGMISTTEGALRLAVHPDLKGNEAGLLEALLGCTDYGVLITSMTTRQDILCNQRFGEIFGIDPNDTVLWTPTLVQERVLPRIKAPEQFLEDLRHVYADSILERVDELELIQPDQTLRRHTTPLMNDKGDVLARVWTFLDITALKTLQRQVELHARHLETLVEERTRALRDMQQQLIESEKLAAVGLLAASIAHDIRNILTPLKIELSVLPGQANPVAEALQGQVQRLTALTHRLLSLSQPARLAVTHTDLRQIWKDAECLIQSQAEYNRCPIQVSLEGQPVLVEANVDQIEQVFVNLAMNALTAMSATGGTLTVDIRTNGGVAQAQFSDTGPGIPDDIADSLFEPFVAGRLGGTGLGLYSSRRIAREHGGNITLEKRKTGGTTFTFQLPLASS